MDQIQQLIDILKQTPEMALWGITIWCLYILAKLASVVWAVKAIFQLAINKWHSYKTRKIELEEKKTDLMQIEKGVEANLKKLDYEEKLFKLKIKYSDYEKLDKIFKDAKVLDVEFDELRMLLNSIKSTTYIHKSDIQKAINILNANKAVTSN